MPVIEFKSFIVAESSEMQKGYEKCHDFKTQIAPPRVEELGGKKFNCVVCSFNASDDLCRGLREILEQAVELDRGVVEYLRADMMSSEHMAPRTNTVDPDLIFLVLAETRPTDTITMLRSLRSPFGSAPLIAVTDEIDWNELYSLLCLGASDFLTVPLRPAEVLPRVLRLLYQTRREDAVVGDLKEKLGLKQLIGENPAFLAEIQKIPLVARSDASVLIAGETGTGKELFAKAIHFLSSRSAKPFSAVNCGALPVDLVENELFGHEPGAFTGANSYSPGLLRETEGGSLLLDEVDSLPPLAQVKLLRFLQEREFRPLGAQRTCRADVRIMAASNVDLDQAVKAGRFRQDLYFRLSVIGLLMPPLRERKEDIPLLARHFVAKHASVTGAPTKELSIGALQDLMLYDWPGNIRELENVIERAVILSPGSVLAPEDLKLSKTVVAKGGESFQDLKAKLVNQFERGYVQELLRANSGNITRAARAAGKHRRAFWEVMRKHHISVTLHPSPLSPALGEGAEWWTRFPRNSSRFDPSCSDEFPVGLQTRPENLIYLKELEFQLFSLPLQSSLARLSGVQFMHCDAPWRVDESMNRLHPAMLLSPPLR